MEIKITENQLDRIKKNDTIKKTFFKFWDKRGGYIDSTLFSLFGFKNGRLKIDDVNITIDDVRNFLIEWRGDEETRKLAEKILNENPYHINDCGGYDFEFDIWDYKISDNNVELTILVNDTRGRVILAMTDGSIMNLRDARTQEDFGWEVENEIQDCLYDFFSVNLSDKIGYSFVFENILYTSDNV